eukprot:10028504-Ditylum_brightwellii.AAC.1
MLDLTHDLHYMMLDHPTTIFIYSHYGQMYSYPVFISHNTNPAKLCAECLILEMACQIQEVVDVGHEPSSAEQGTWVK